MQQAVVAFKADGVAHAAVNSLLAVILQQLQKRHGFDTDDLAGNFVQLVGSADLSMGGHPGDQVGES